MARRRLGAELRAHGLREPAVWDATLVLSELLSNAIRHARPLPGARIRAAWTIGNETIELEVSDGGAPTRPRAAPPSASLPDGRGLAIVECLCLRWGVRAEDAQTTVWAELPASVNGARSARGRRAAVSAR